MRARFVARIATALLGLSLAQASDYYVSPSGSDSAPGTLAQPFVTIQKAASVMVAGDTAYIRAGTYRETVTPAHSGTQSAPITFTSYNGESVTVSGADVIPATQWTLSSGSIYAAPMNWDLGAGRNQVFLDSQMMVEARWPNTTLDLSHPTVAQTNGGTVSVHGGNTSLSTATITSPGLPSKPAGYWNGAMINIRLGAGWGWQTGTVTDSPAGNSQLSFTYHEWTGATDAITPTPDNPFFLWGKLNELDSASEWFRQGAASNPSLAGTLYLWTPQSDNPAQHLVEAKRRQFAFNLSGLSFITVQGVGIFAAAVTTDVNSHDLLLDGLRGQYQTHYLMSSYNGGPSLACCTGLDGGVILQGTNNVLRNSTFEWAASDGVYINGSGHRVFNNLIHDTGYYAAGDSSLVAAGSTPTDGVIVGWNTVHNSAREGVIFSYGGPANFTHGRIIYNSIYDFGLQTNDLGCTYSGNSNGQGTEIAYNVCHDNHSTSPYGGGIYLDNNTSNYVVHHNVTWNVVNALQLTTGGPHRIFNNTLIGTSASLNGGGVNGTVFENNVFTASVLPLSYPGAIASHNTLPGTDPQFVDPTNHNYQLRPTSPAISAGLVIPPCTNGFTGPAPDIGAYDHNKRPWKAGVQNAATVSAPSYAPTLTPGTVAVVTGSVPFDSGVSVVLTDGANVDWPAPLVYVVDSPPQLAFQVPAGAAPGVAMITITNGDGTISLSSAPLFAGPPLSITASQGSGQSAIIDTLFPTALQATVKNASGNAVPDAAVTFTAPSNGTGGSFAVSATVTTNASGVAIAPAFVANSVAGTYTVIASAAGVGTPAVFNLTNTAKPSQTITFGPLSNVTFGAAPFMIAATASSGLTVSFASNTPVVCTVAGSTVTIVAAGTCSITASQAGNPNYPAATPVTQSFAVATASGPSAPAITNVENAATFQATLAPNAYVAIFGQNLSTTNPGRAWAAADFTSNSNGTLNMPTSLDGTSVMIGGASAYMTYVSPGQLNIIIPAVVVGSGIPVVVTVNGQRSAAFNVTLQSLAPSFFAWQPNTSDYGKYLIAQHANYTNVGKAGLFPGTPANFTTPASPGETIILYGTGFGPTSPQIASGIETDKVYPLSPTPAATFGGKPATVVFGGLIPPLSQVYQFDVTIPSNAASGDSPLVVTVNGTQSFSGLITVQQ